MAVHALSDSIRGVIRGKSFFIYIFFYFYSKGISFIQYEKGLEILDPRGCYLIQGVEFIQGAWFFLFQDRRIANYLVG